MAAFLGNQIDLIKSTTSSLGFPDRFDSIYTFYAWLDVLTSSFFSICFTQNTEALHRFFKKEFCPRCNLTPLRIKRTGKNRRKS